MTEQASPPVDAEPAASAPAAQKRSWYQVWKPRERKPKRPLLIRLFGLSIWGTLKLVLLCILTGFIMLAMQFDPSDPSFNATDAIGALISNALATGKWAVTNFWKPAFAGASIIVPIWVLWRLITLPFRR